MSGPLRAAKMAERSFRIITASMLAGFMAACGEQVGPEVAAPSAPKPVGEAAVADAPPSQPITGPSHVTTTPAGHYLAARQALYFNDVGQSATFFLETLAAGSDSIPLLRQAFLTQYYYGDIERAAALGRQLEGLDVIVPLGGEPGTALAIRKGDWAAALVLADKIAEDGTAQVLAGIIRAWSLVATGRGDAGISTLLEAGRLTIDAEGGMPPYFRLHAALMAEYLGLEAEAEHRANGLEDRLQSAHLMLQLAAFKARRGDWQAVDDIITGRLSTQFNQSQVRAALENQADTRTDPSRMIADAIVAMALDDRDNESGQSISARLRFSLFIDPDNHFSRLLLAQQMADFGQADVALANLARISDTNMYGQLARLTESSVIEDEGDIPRAIDTLQRVVEMDPENASLHQRLGDIHRRHEQFRQSRDAYMAALELGRDSGGLHRSLGVALERLGETRAAETHLLRAIEIDPSDAYALNYLGYWWADEGRNLEEAIAMIERAVSKRPDSGFFVDSLGWVHFRLGDPVTAVGYLERATELEPSDPEITGHLGDVYWVLGRRDEARFKWRLALSLSRDEDEQEMLSDRLANGLPESEMPAGKIPGGD